MAVGGARSRATGVARLRKMASTLVSAEVD
jgi:hypothetical protein